MKKIHIIKKFHETFIIICFPKNTNPKIIVKLLAIYIKKRITIVTAFEGDIEALILNIR